MISILHFIDDIFILSSMPCWRYVFLTRSCKTKKGAVDQAPFSILLHISAERSGIAIRSVEIVQWERVHARRSCHNNHDDSSISAVLGQSSKDGWMPLIHIFQMSRFRKAFIDSPFDAAYAAIISLSVCLQECSSFSCR